MEQSVVVERLAHGRPRLFSTNDGIYFGRDVDFCNSVDEAVDFAKADQNSILVTTDQQYANMKDKLPESTQVIERISQFPNRGEVLVLGDKSLIR